MESSRTISTSLVPSEGDVESNRGSAKFHKSARIETSNVSEFTSDPSEKSENALLIKVLRNMRQSPISLQDFQEYLDKELAGELSRFFVEADKHEGKASERAPQAIPMAHNIADHFIRMNAEEEINISEVDRTRILKKLDENDQEAGLDPSLFKDAKGEVIKMLSGDKFQRFLKRQLETNISHKEAKRRWISGVIFLSLSLVIVGILMWVQTFAESPFNVRWWRLVVYPLLLWGAGLVLSSRAQVCSGLASKCVRMRDNESWFAAFQQSPGTPVVKDELALTKIMQKAQQINRGSLYYSIAAMVVLVLLPPGYGLLTEG